jgi:hypothetical protein
VAVRRVHHQHVDAGLHQRGDALLGAGAGADGGADAQPLVAVLAGLREVSAFWMSLTVIMPRSSKASLTTSTFSIRCWCSRRCTSSRLGALAHRHQLARAAS